MTNIRHKITIYIKVLSKHFAIKLDYKFCKIIVMYALLYSTTIAILYRHTLEAMYRYF